MVVVVQDLVFGFDRGKFAIRVVHCAHLEYVSPSQTSEWAFYSRR
jgi:hypothetical protein